MSPDKISVYKSLIGSGIWIVILGRFDIAYAINALSRYSMAPREGHLTALQRVYGYLRVRTKGRLVVDVRPATVREQVDLLVVYNWSEFYPDAVEETKFQSPGSDNNLLC